MPPALRNQRAPTAGDTPAPTAASSVEHPAAIAAQNSWRSSRRATEGRPGDGNAPRPDRSERRFRMAIATSSLKVLRRPLEPKGLLRIEVEPESRVPGLCGCDEQVSRDGGFPKAPFRAEDHHGFLLRTWQRMHDSETGHHEGS